MAVGGIRLAGLAKTFQTPQGPVRAVAGIDLEIAPGETVALLGPNGAGKSTTIEMLLGLTRPDAGTVSVFGLSPEGAVDAGGELSQLRGVAADEEIDAAYAARLVGRGGHPHGGVDDDPTVADDAC